MSARRAAVTARAGALLTAAALGLGACIEFEPVTSPLAPRERAPRSQARLTVERTVTQDSTGALALGEYTLSVFLALAPAQDARGRTLPHVTPRFNGDTLPRRPARPYPATQVDWLWEGPLGPVTIFEVSYPPDPVYTDWQPLHSTALVSLGGQDTLTLTEQQLVLLVENRPAAPWTVVLSVRLVGDSTTTTLTINPLLADEVRVPSSIFPGHSGVLRLDAHLEAEDVIGSDPMLGPWSRALLLVRDTRLVRVASP